MAAAKPPSAGPRRRNIRTVNRAQLASDAIMPRSLHFKKDPVNRKATTNGIEPSAKQASIRRATAPHRLGLARISIGLIGHRKPQRSSTAIYAVRPDELGP